MRAEVFVEDVSLGKHEFASPPMVGHSVLSDKGAVAKIDAVVHDLAERRVKLWCQWWPGSEPDVAATVAKVDGGGTAAERLKAAHSRQMEHLNKVEESLAVETEPENEETNPETPAEASPTQAIRRSGKRRRG